MIANVVQDLRPDLGIIDVLEDQSGQIAVRLGIVEVVTEIT